MNQAATGAMAELLRGVTIEAVWFVEATYAPDAAATREPYQAEHLARLVERPSAIAVDAESEEAALDLFRDDLYLRNSVWVAIHARPFGRLTFR